MIKYKFLYEDQRLPQLRVISSKKIRNNFELIREFNKNNQDGLSEWCKYIDFLENYLSNPVIAWDNTGERCYIMRNGGMHMVDDALGIDVMYCIPVDRFTGGNYVYIFNLDYQLDRFGLKRPPNLKENKLFLSPIIESYLHNLIKQSLRTSLMEHMRREKKERYLYS